MATEEVILEYKATGDLPAELAKMEAGVARLGDEHKKVHSEIQGDLKKSTEGVKTFSSNVNVASQVVVALSKSVGAGLPALAKNLAGIADLTEQVKTGLSSTDKANFTSVNNALREIAAKEGIVVEKIDAAKQARLDALVTTKKLTEEEARLLGNVQAVVDTLKEAEGIGPKAIVPGDLPPGTTPEPGGNLPDLDEPTQKLIGFRTQLRLAREEQLQFLEQEGPLGDGYKKASAEVARLNKLLKDAATTTKALDPGDKVGAFTALGNAIAGGAQAVSGFAIALGGNNQALQESLFKFQSILFGVQGARAFLADFSDAYNNLRLQLGLTTAAQEENLVVSEAQVVADEAVAAATEAKAIAAGKAAIAERAAAVAAQAQLAAQEEGLAVAQADAVVTQEQAVATAAEALAAEAAAVAQTAQTEATAAGLAASEADAVAKAAQATATEAVGAASVTAATGMKAFAASLLASPLFPIALLLIAAGAAFAFFTREEEKATLKYGEFLDLLNRGIERRDLDLQVKQAELSKKLAEEALQRQKDFEAGRRASADQTRAEIERDAARKAELDGAATKREKDTRKASFAELQDLKRDAVKTDENQRVLDITNQEKFAELRKALDLKESATKEEVIKAYYDRKKEFREGDAKEEEQLSGTELGNLSKAIQERKDLFRELQTLKQAALDADKTGRVGDILDEEKFSELKLALDLDENATKEEVAKAYYDKKNEFRTADLRATADALNKEAAALDAEAARLALQVEKQRAYAEQVKGIREQLASQIEAIEKQLAEKLEALRVEDADPAEKLERQKAAAKAELDELEKNLKREFALREIGAAKLIGLSEREQQALADAKIAQGGGVLPTTDQENFAAARLLIEKGYLDAVVDLYRENDLTVAHLTGDRRTRALAELDADLVKRAEQLRLAGKTQVEIEEDAARQVLLVEQSLAANTLKIQEDTQIAQLETLKASGDQGALAQRAVEEKLLEVRIEFAEKALLLIADTSTEEGKLRVAEARELVAKLKRELGDLRGKVIPVSILDLLGIKEVDKAAVNAGLASIRDSISAIENEGIAARDRALAAQVENTDLIIADLQRRGDELKEQLAKDTQANKDGEANNLDATLAAIAANKAAEERALADKRKLVAERAKLAKQQAVTDSIAQASSLATAGATLFAKGAFEGPAGIITAIATIAAMIAAFIGIKGKIAAASQPQAFFRGTKSVQLRGAPDGVDTVPAMLTKDEAVVPTQQNEKYRGMVAAIIDDDFTNLPKEQLDRVLGQINLDDLLKGTGVVLSEKEVSKTITLHKEVATLDRQPVLSVGGLERRLDDMSSQLAAFKKQEGARLFSTRLPDGTVMIHDPKTKETQYIRP